MKRKYNYLDHESIHTEGIINCRLTINYDDIYSKYYPDVSKQQIKLFSTYPEHTYTDLKCAIRKKYHLKDVELASGNEDLIIRINRIAQNKKWSVGMVVPIFYRTVETCPKFEKIRESILFKIENSKFDLIWINNPNLFSGKSHTRKDLLTLIKNSPHTLFAIDEAAIFSIRQWQDYSLLGHIKEMDNAIVLNSFSKMFGVAGLRAAFASGNRKILNEINKVGPTFPLSSIAEIFILKLLKQDSLLEKVNSKIEEHKNRLLHELEKKQIKTFPTLVNCIYFKNEQFRKKLEKAGILCLNLDDQLDVPRKGVTRMTVHSSEEIFRTVLRRIKDED